MLKMVAVGMITKLPEFKMSAKGTPFLRFNMEIPAAQGRYPRKLGVVVFGKQAEALSTQIGLHMLVSCSGEPQARGAQSKDGKLVGYLDMLADSVTVQQNSVQRPYQQQPAQEAASFVQPNLPAPSFGDDDIPF